MEDYITSVHHKLSCLGSNGASSSSVPQAFNGEQIRLERSPNRSPTEAGNIVLEVA